VLSMLDAGPLHGYELAKRIDKESGGKLRFTLASLYPLLYRMEGRGWVRGNWETSHGGRRRRYYCLTPKGRKNLPSLRAEWRQLFRALERLAGAVRA
jgi:PadR family transcriptional regulator PadR